MSVWKKLGIATLILLLIGCLGIDIWYLWVSSMGKDKVVANTFEVGLQELKDGSTKYFVEVNSMADIFEVKFNYLLDENRDSFFSQGLQFVADKNGNINFYFNEESDESKQTVTNVHGWLAWEEGTYNRFVYGVKGDNTYNYMSGDNYESVQLSTNELSSEKNRFKITLGNDIYMMSFKGYDIGFTNLAGSYRARNTWGSLMNWTVNQYYSSDVYYFCKLLYHALQSEQNGVASARIFEFGDLFNYYAYNEESGKYDEKVDLDKAHSISEDLRSYYSIFVKKSDTKIQKASESLFHCVAGNSSYNVSRDYSGDDFFIGRDVITAGNKAFDLVKVVDNNYTLKLKDSFIADYEDIADVIFLRVEIDLDFYKNKGINFVGFTADSQLDLFKYKEIYTLETKNGDVVKSVVTL